MTVTFDFSPTHDFFDNKAAALMAPCAQEKVNRSEPSFHLHATTKFHGLRYANRFYQVREHINSR